MSLSDKVAEYVSRISNQFGIALKKIPISDIENDEFDPGNQADIVALIHDFLRLSGTVSESTIDHLVRIYFFGPAGQLVTSEFKGAVCTNTNKYSDAMKRLTEDYGSSMTGLYLLGR